MCKPLKKRVSRHKLGSTNTRKFLPTHLHLLAFLSLIFGAAVTKKNTGREYRNCGKDVMLREIYIPKNTLACIALGVNLFTHLMNSLMASAPSTLRYRKK